MNKDPRCNPFLTKAAYLESGIKQLIIEIQNVILAEQIMESRDNNLDDKSLGSFIDNKIETVTDKKQGHTIRFNEKQYINEWCDD